MLVRQPAILAIVVAALSGPLSAGAQVDSVQSKPRILPTGEWVIVQGESPASLARLLYPGQPVVQRRFVAALAEANPLLGIDADGVTALAEGSTLRMPDWRRLAEPHSVRSTVPQVARRTTNDAVAGVASVPTETVMPKAAGQRAERPVSERGLRMDTSLALSPAVDEQMRAILRLEFRLLMALGDQLSATGQFAVPPADSLTETGRGTLVSSLPPVETQPLPVSAPEPTLSSVASVESASVRAPVVAEPVSVPVPIKLKQSPPAAVPATEADSDRLPYYAAGLITLLVMVGWLVRRRRQPDSHESSLDHAETVVLESPPSATPSAMLATAAAEDNVAALRTQVQSPHELPKAPDMSDVNPVMELAEIMLSFGRVQSAAQTLQEYIEANPREALQPWVKLLDIYREGNMRDQFDALASKLHQNFNVELQRWDGSIPLAKPDASFARSTTLEELPHIVDQIVSRWPGKDCQDYLRRLLRDNRSGERSGFTLPVVQEILLLIEILGDRNAVGHA